MGEADTRAHVLHEAERVGTHAAGDTAVPAVVVLAGSVAPSRTAAALVLARRTAASAGTPAAVEQEGQVAAAAESAAAAAAAAAVPAVAAVEQAGAAISWSGQSLSMHCTWAVTMDPLGTVSTRTTHGSAPRPPSVASWDPKQEACQSGRHTRGLCRVKMQRQAEISTVLLKGGLPRSFAYSHIHNCAKVRLD